MNLGLWRSGFRTRRAAAGGFVNENPGSHSADLAKIMNPYGIIYVGLP